MLDKLSDRELENSLLDMISGKDRLYEAVQKAEEVVGEITSRLVARKLHKEELEKVEVEKRRVEEERCLLEIQHEAELLAARVVEERKKKMLAIRENIKAKELEKMKRLEEQVNEVVVIFEEYKDEAGWYTWLNDWVDAARQKDPEIKIREVVTKVVNILAQANMMLVGFDTNKVHM